MCVGGAQPIVCEPIDIRSSECCGSIRGHVAITEIVGHDEHNVGFALTECARRPREERGSKQCQVANTRVRHFTYPCRFCVIRWPVIRESLRAPPPAAAG